MDDPGVDPIAEQLRRRRIALDLSQVELARKAGVARSTISGGEKGTHSYNLTTARALAQAMGWTLVLRDLRDVTRHERATFSGEL